MKIAIIMPVLNPDHKMTDFLSSLLDAGFEDVIIVNDGSKAETVHFFEEADAHKEVTVLTHEVNRGKGAGLKTAFSYLAQSRPDIDGAVTVDGDGQHDVASIRNCLAKFEEEPHAVIIGGRDFDDPSVPWRSRTGNKISRVIYRFACGIKLNDTQTGLRVIPAEYFEKFSALKGDRYEYETNMLISLVNLKIPYYEVPIKTIYIDDNASSHFNTFTDSFKIYKIVLANFFKFIIASVSSWLVDIGVFTLTGLILDRAFPEVSAGYLHTIYDVSLRVIICTIVARLISSFFNFMVNRKTVFKSTDGFGQTAKRYYILAVCQLLASLLLVDLFADKVLGVTGILQTIVKCVVDLLLFLLSFNIQRRWVFQNKKA